MDGVVLAVSVTWNVPHGCWFVMLVPRRADAWLRRSKARDAVAAGRHAIEAAVEAYPDLGPAEWFTKQEWDREEKDLGYSQGGC